MKYLVCMALTILSLMMNSPAFADISAVRIESLVQENLNTAQEAQDNYEIQKNEMATKNEKTDSVTHESAYALIFFYMSSCIHCRRFDPILKAEAEKYHITVYPFTLNGTSLPDFPQSETPSKEFLSHFFPSSKPITVPTVFLVNVKTMQAYLVNQGELSSSEFENRLHELTTHIHAQGGAA